MILSGESGFALDEDELGLFDAFFASLSMIVVSKVSVWFQNYYLWSCSFHFGQITRNPHEILFLLAFLHSDLER